MKSSKQNHLFSTVVTVCLALGVGWFLSAFPFGRTFSWADSERQALDASDSSVLLAPVAVHSGDGVVHVTATDFEEQVLRSSVPVLVDFYADWCGPCKFQAPVLDELAREIDTAKIVKVNIDDDHDLVSRFQIGSIPTLLIFKNGQFVARYTGFASKTQLKAILARA